MKKITNGFFIVLLFIIIFLILKSFKYLDSEKHFMIETPSYNLKISYPVFKSKKLNKKITNFVTLEQEKFFKNLNKINNKAELKINYQIKKQVNFTLINLYSYTILEKGKMQKNVLNIKYKQNARQKNNCNNYQDVMTITINKRDLTTFKNKKLLCFTFDDGPGGIYTKYLLDNLDKYKARVSFFILGSRINLYPENLLRAYKMGNTIGNHTYNHFNLNILNDNLALEEINKTNSELETLLNTKTIFLRPPYGNIKTKINNELNMYTILWDIDPKDWQNKNKIKIKNHIVKHAHDGAIILLHDIYKSSVDGALLAMAELAKKGYAFVSIEEIIQLRQINLEPTKKYYSF